MKTFQILRMRIGCAILMSLPLVTGCAVGPDFRRPEAPKATAYAPDNSIAKTTVSAPVLAGESQRFDPRADIPADWWTLFGSPQINSLIERAFKASPDIASAQAALRQAQQNVIAQQGFFYPTVGVNYTPSRNKLAGNMGGNSPGMQGNGHLIQTYTNPNPGPGLKNNGPAYFNFHVAQLSVGFVPDVFGLNSRQVEAAKTQVASQQMQLEAAYITLASNLVAAAIQEASIRAQIAATEKIVGINKEMLELLRTQLRLGDVSDIDVANAQASLASAEQALAPLQAQLEQTRDMIRALAGNTPDDDVAEKFELASMRLPEALPLSLPSKIVEQRPDVRAAEEQMHYASAQAGVAVANRLPQFALSAGIGGMADTPSWMFRSGGGFFNLAASVSQTIFDGGTLKARSRAAEQALVQAGEQYRSTVIAALQNVADTLYTIQSDANMLKQAAIGAQAASTIAELTRRQYQSGAVGYQAQLAADMNDQLAQINLLQAQASRLGDTAALYQALGGGWWNRSDAQSPKQPPVASVRQGGMD